MNEVYLLMGGNIGDRFSYLTKVCTLIEQQAGEIVARSSVYETAAWGIENQEAFLNQVICIRTELPSAELLKEILAIEETLGRKRLEKYGPRIIDIDILLYNTEIIDTPTLTVPHPALPNRRFALTPLVEIAGDFLHPTLKKSFKQLLDECKDMLPVIKFNAGNNNSHVLSQC